MRELVTLIVSTCDLCGTKYEETMGGKPQVETVEWAWDSELWEIDLDRECRQKVRELSIEEVLKMSHEAAPKKRRSPTAQVKAGVDKYQQFRQSNGTYRCPAVLQSNGQQCDFSASTGRGVAMHHAKEHHESLIDKYNLGKGS